MTQEQIQFQKPSEADFIKEMEDQFLQINGFMEIVKSLKADAKEAGYDSAILAKVAKSRADDKVSELKEKTELLLTYLEDE